MRKARRPSRHSLENQSSGDVATTFQVGAVENHRRLGSVKRTYSQNVHVELSGKNGSAATPEQIALKWHVSATSWAVGPTIRQPRCRAQTHSRLSIRDN